MVTFKEKLGRIITTVVVIIDLLIGTVGYVGWYTRISHKLNLKPNLGRES